MEAGERQIGPARHQRGVAFDLWRETTERTVRRAAGKRDLLVALDQAKALPFRLADVIKGFGAPAAPAASSIKGKRAREEEEESDDEVFEVDSKGNPINNKRARRN